MDHIRVDPPNTNNKWVRFGLANVDIFIIRVGFELKDVDTIRTLTRHEHVSSTRISTPTCTHDPTPQSHFFFLLIFFFFIFLIKMFVINILK